MNKLSSLIQINEDLMLVMKEIESCEGELTLELETKLESILTASADKVSNYALVMDKYNFEIEFVEEKIKQANEYKASLAKQIERMESIALKVIKARGEKLVGSNGRWISTRKSSSVVIEDPGLIPPDYVRIKIEPDKTAIKKAIESGEMVSGATIEHKERINYK